MYLATVVTHDPGHPPTLGSTLAYLLLSLLVVLVGLGAKKVLARFPRIKHPRIYVVIARALSCFLVLVLVSVAWTLWLRI